MVYFSIKVINNDQTNICFILRNGNLQKYLYVLYTRFCLDSPSQNILQLKRECIKTHSSFQLLFPNSEVLNQIPPFRTSTNLRTITLGLNSSCSLPKWLLSRTIYSITWWEGQLASFKIEEISDYKKRNIELDSSLFSDSRGFRTDIIWA